MFLLLDLPASTPLVDLSKMAALDMGKLPKVEESGERCIRRIQEFIINELSSSEAAVLPEDKLQRLVVGVCNSYSFLMNLSLFLSIFYESTNPSLHF